MEKSNYQQLLTDRVIPSNSETRIVIRFEEKELEYVFNGSTFRAWRVTEETTPRRNGIWMQRDNNKFVFVGNLDAPSEKSALHYEFCSVAFGKFADNYKIPEAHFFRVRNGLVDYINHKEKVHYKGFDAELAEGINKLLKLLSLPIAYSGDLNSEIGATHIVYSNSGVFSTTSEVYSGLWVINSWVMNKIDISKLDLIDDYEEQLNHLEKISHTHSQVSRYFDFKNPSAFIPF